MESNNGFIDYAQIIDQMRRMIVKKALSYATNGSLPGEHHFYIAFLTEYPGVQISEKLKKRYQPEMTIVLQHQFENLVIDDDRFSIVLSFDSVKERVIVPYSAIVSFSDPSVNFGLQFKAPQISNSHVNQDLEKTENPVVVQQDKQSKKYSDNVISLDKFRKN